MCIFVILYAEIYEFSEEVSCMFKVPALRKVSLGEAVALIVLVLAILGGVMIFVPGATPHIAILAALVVLLIYGLIRKVKYADMQAGMAKSVSTSMSAIYLFFFIGILITSLMMSGAIPTLMYYGLNIISAKTFYLSAFVVSAIIGISIGSSLTTVSTLGVALLGISGAFAANPAITAGAIVSGAFFGDKMSPLSDTTGIAASIVGVDLFDHIKNMMKTTVPVFLISCVFYYLLSLNIHIGSIENINSFKTDLLATGLVHWYALIPFFILLVMALFKVSSIVSMLTASMASLAITFLHSAHSIADLAKFYYSGFSMEGIPESIVSLVSRGGISSMFFTITVVILALSLGGLLFSLGIVSTVLDKTANVLNSAFRATFAVALSGLGINYVVGEQYLSILLTGETFKPIYEKLGLKPQNLSRALEDAGTVINPLVPWSVCGTFIASTLGVPVFSYLPFAIFCYGSLLFTILAGITGLGISKKK